MTKSTIKVSEKWSMCCQSVCHTQKICIYDTFMVPIFHFWSLPAMVSIHFHYMKKNSLKILLNISFCDLQKKYYCKVSTFSLLNQLYLSRTVLLKNISSGTLICLVTLPNMKKYESFLPHKQCRR